MPYRLIAPYRPGALRTGACWLRYGRCGLRSRQAAPSGWTDEPMRDLLGESTRAVQPQRWELRAPVRCTYGMRRELAVGKRSVAIRDWASKQPMRGNERPGFAVVLPPVRAGTRVSCKVP